MFNYIANAPDSLDLVNRITESRANQLKNAIYAAQEPQIRASTAYTLQDTALLPQQRDAALMAAYARYARVPFQNYKDTTTSLTPGAKAQNIADHPNEIANINKMAIDALSAGSDPYIAQMLAKYGIRTQPQGGSSPMMQQAPQVPQGNQSPMVSSNQPQDPASQSQTPSSNATNLQNAAMTQDPSDPNAVPVVNSPSTPASNLQTVTKSESQMHGMTSSQETKLPFSQNLSVTLANMKKFAPDAAALAGSGFDIPYEYGKLAYNATAAAKLFGKMDIDPRFIKYKTYMDSLELMAQQLRQAYGASIQPGQIEAFKDQFEPKKFFDDKNTFMQRFNVGANNIEQELKTFKTPVSTLISPQFQQQQTQNVIAQTKAAQDKALQGNAMSGSGRIRMRSPDGKTGGSVSASRLQEFLKKGYAVE